MLKFAILLAAVVAQEPDAPPAPDAPAPEDADDNADDNEEASEPVDEAVCTDVKGKRKVDNGEMLCGKDLNLEGCTKRGKKKFWKILSDEQRENFKTGMFFCPDGQSARAKLAEEDAPCPTEFNINCNLMKENGMRCDPVEYTDDTDEDEFIFGRGMCKVSYDEKTSKWSVDGPFEPEGLDDYSYEEDDDSSAPADNEADEPTADEPAAEEPATEEPAPAPETTAEEPPAEEPPAEESTDFNPFA